MSQAVNRKTFHRTDISLKEQAIGGFIILMLAAIAVGVFLQGRSFDPSKYTGDAAALESTRQAVEGKAATLRNEADFRSNELYSVEAASDTTNAAAVLPALIEPLAPMGPTEHYTEATLYEKINGRAPAYFEYNFQELTARSFSIQGSPADYLDVFLYKMDSPLNAFGIFSAERDAGGTPLNFVDDGYLSGMGYFFRYGPVYAQILASSETPFVLATAESYARALVKFLDPDNSGLEGRAFLPVDNQVPGSLTYINENAYGQEVLNSVFEARYTADGIEFTAFAQQSTDPDTARSNWETLKEFYTRYGTLDEELRIGEASVFVGEVFGEWNVVYQREGVVSGVVNAADRDVAVDFIKSQLGNEEPGTLDEYSY